jgi:hypothetical protein
MKGTPAASVERQRIEGGPDDGFLRHQGVYCAAFPSSDREALIPGPQRFDIWL